MTFSQHLKLIIMRVSETEFLTTLDKIIIMRVSETEFLTKLNKMIIMRVPETEFFTTLVNNYYECAC